MRVLKHGTMRAHVALAVAALVLAGDALQPALAGGGFNYKDALTKSIIFLEAQRSGKLPPNNRVKWRGDSGLEDGKLANVDLTGGYYDAGDNVKYGLPLAFTVTTLAWTALAFKPELESAKELDHVGDPNLDHQCWVRPENMKAPRTLYEIDETMPGTEIAAETAAAFAASSIVFRNDKKYSRALLNKAKLKKPARPNPIRQLFLFAKSHQGSYDGECPFYCSYSGYNDELLWAATWLYLATKRQRGRVQLGPQVPRRAVLLAEFNMTSGGGAQSYKSQADNFVCAVLPDTAFRQVFITPGGVIHLRDGANSHTAFLFVVYADLLSRTGQTVLCSNQPVRPERLREFALQQVDYLLGANPRGSSYVVGFGANPPTQPHHRGASTPVLPPGYDVNCGLSFGEWFAPDRPNPNELTGAIMGGPDKNDSFVDKRANSYTEPCTYINSLAIGPLAARGGNLVATH
ncbi:endoglucanase 8 [Panicum miliaceum]|uniref:Endoglucanase n=1 Tax=Panicum miliaceum TaxID=4540 RepID=A0A3L6PNB5_PANMI|nr:endoglucanase 8 [Panicum miliaceum]